MDNDEIEVETFEWDGTIEELYAKYCPNARIIRNDGKRFTVALPNVVKE